MNFWVDITIMRASKGREQKVPFPNRSGNYDCLFIDEFWVVIGPLDTLLLWRIPM